MPLPQVNDRLKEIPAQALRTVFATIGQLLLVADRLRARAAEQLSGSGEATAAPPPQKAPATPPPAPRARRTAPAPDAGSTRWRSLDKTGNVRLLDGDEDQDEEDLAVPATPAARQPSGSGFPVSGPAAPGPAARAVADPVPAPVEYTPTEPVPAVTTPAELASPEPPLVGTAAASPADLAAEPAPADRSPVLPAPADVAPAEPAPAPAVPEPADLAPAEPPPAGLAPAVEALPVPNYDQLTVASLRARLRVLDAAQLQLLLDYEKAHEGRPAVTIMFERRLAKLSEGS